MSGIIQSLQNFIQQLFGQRPTMPKNPKSRDAKFVHKLMHVLEATQDEELGCEAVFEVMDLYAEAVLRGEDVSKAMPLVQQHLELCGNCQEEVEMLIEMMGLEREPT